MDYKEKVIALLNDQELSKEQKEKLENIFPELKESENEDEKIRKGLIKAVSRIFEGHKLYDTDVTREEALAWLEKQKVTGEEIIFRPIVGTDIRIAAKQALEKIDTGKKIVLAFNGAYIPVNGKTVGEIDSEYDAWLGMQDEQKPADKIEPKFHEDDWIIFNGSILHIDEIVNGYYRTTSRGDGIHNSYDWDIDNAARLWTIEEAKVGTVLVDEDNNIGIYIGKNDDFWHSCIYLGCDGCLRGFSIGGYHKHKNTKPAIKEQRDLLFQKMKEAGYEWDSENKELKKIEIKSKNLEPKTLNADKVIEWLRYHIQVDEPKIEYNKDGQPLAESFIAHAKARCMAADEVIEQFKNDFGL